MTGRRLAARLAWRLRLTPLGLAAGIASGLLLGGTLLGLAWPGFFDLGAGNATLAGNLARSWLPPLAALLLLGCGSPAVLEGLQRTRRRAPALLDPTAGPARGLEDGLVSLLLFAGLALLFLPPFVWLARLGVLLPGTGARLATLLGGAALLGAVTCQLGAALGRRPGPALLGTLLLQAGGVCALHGWLGP